MTTENIEEGTSGGSALTVGLGGAVDLPTCKFCSTEAAIKPGCAKQRWRVCDAHFMVACPECGHEAFWMQDMKRGPDRYVCFSMTCDWVAFEPPNAEVTGRASAACEGPR